MNFLNDEQMITAIKQGDETAINDVIKKYAKLMWFIASSILHKVESDQDIEECVADVLVYLWRNQENMMCGAEGSKCGLQWLPEAKLSINIGNYQICLAMSLTCLLFMREMALFQFR